jgi:hypothetical protein
MYCQLCLRFFWRWCDIQYCLRLFYWILSILFLKTTTFPKVTLCPWSGEETPILSGPQVELFWNHGSRSLVREYTPNSVGPWSMDHGLRVTPPKNPICTLGVWTMVWSSCTLGPNKCRLPPPCRGTYMGPTTETKCFWKQLERWIKATIISMRIDCCDFNN